MPLLIDLFYRYSEATLREVEVLSRFIMGTQIHLVYLPLMKVH